MHEGVVQGRQGTGRGTTWTVKWEGYPKSAVHVGKELSTVRLEPPNALPAPAHKGPEADGAPPKPKGGASKPKDVVQATWEDSEDEDDSNDSDDEEGGGGGHRPIQPKTEKRCASRHVPRAASRM